MKNICKWLLSLFSLVAFSGQAQSFCFASAVSYYEQVYCELQAKGEAKNLPPFYQFKRNDPTTQALLLKRPASRIGIDLPMPKSARKTAQTAEKKLPAAQLTPASNPAATSANKRVAIQTSTGSQQPRPVIATAIAKMDCEVKGEKIQCGAQHFRLTGNLRNQRLAQNALTAENKMALPVYRGTINDQQAIDTYMLEAYRRYIEQMHAIGLGGVTMTYGKFYFLFFDLQEKGLNFSQRFETMYDFLKKDKAAMGVSEKLTRDDQLTEKDCDLLSEQMLVCSRAGRNYLYLVVSE